MNTVIRRPTPTTTLIIFIVILVMLAFVLNALPVLLTCAGIWLVIALVLVTLTLGTGRTALITGDNTQTVEFRPGQILLTTFLFWICGLTLAATAFGLIPAGIVVMLRTIKRRLVMSIFRREAAQSEVKIASLDELHRLSPGRWFTMESVALTGASPLHASQPGVIPLVLVRGGIPQRTWQLHPMFRLDSLTLTLPDGDWHILPRSAEIVLPDAGQIDASTVKFGIAPVPGDTLRVAGQVAISDEKNPHEPRYRITLLELLQAPRRLTAAETDALLPNTPVLNPFQSSPFSPKPAVRYLPAETSDDASPVLRDADIDGDPE